MINNAIVLGDTVTHFSKVTCVFGCLCASFITAEAFSATPFSLLHQIVNPTPAAGDAFGTSVSAAGDRFVITAPFDDTAGQDAGAAYLFDRSGTLVQTLKNPAATSGNAFGGNNFSVAMVGDKIVVTAVLDDTVARDGGAAYLFDQSGNLLHSYFDPVPGVDDRFGNSVAAVGDDKFIIGAHRDRRWAGRAFLFDVEGNLVSDIPNPMPEGLDVFGRNVGPFGEFVLVGADNDASLGPGSAEGATYLYDQAGNLLQSIAPPSPDTGRRFGFASAGFEERIIVADFYDSSGALQSGAVHLFDTAGNHLRTMDNPMPGDNDYFGITIAWVEGNILVGAPFDDTAAVDAGAAYLFNTNGDLLHTFLDPAASPGSQFGSALAAIGNDFLIAAMGDDTGADSTGTAYLFAAISELKFDFNDDGLCNVEDIDALTMAIRNGTTDIVFDVNRDGRVNLLDRVAWVTDVKQTVFGDANLDGEFNSSDLVQLYQAGEFADGISGNSTWGEGDFGGDGEFDSDDLVLALQTGSYEQGPVAGIGVVPEPSSILSLILAVHLMAVFSRQRRIADRAQRLQRQQCGVKEPLAILLIN